MLPKRYTIILADRSSGVVSRFTVAIRPLLAVLAVVLAIPVLMDLHAHRSASAEIDRLQLRNATLEVEVASYRAATAELLARISSVQTAMAALAERAELDPSSRRAIETLPASLRNRAVAGTAIDGSANAMPSAALSSPKYTFDVLRDLLGNLENRLQRLQIGVARQQALAAATPSIWPADGWLSAAYGYRRDPFTGERTFHPAVDISTSRGQPVYATAAGLVSSASRSGAYGNLVVLEHGFQLRTRYGHLLQFAVKPGDTVKRGDVIGYIGATGRATGTHVHYEVWVNGRAMNPLRLLPARPLAAN